MVQAQEGPSSWWSGPARQGSCWYPLKHSGLRELSTYCVPGVEEIVLSISWLHWRGSRLCGDTGSRTGEPDGVLTPRHRRLGRHVGQRQLPGALLPAHEHHAAGAAPDRVAVVRRVLLRAGPGVQPAGPERAGRGAGAALLLPHPPGRPGPHRLPGAAGHRGHRGVAARGALRLAGRRPRLPPLPLHGGGHGVLRAVPAAPGRRHGLGALRGHHAALLAPVGHVAPRLGHRGAGVAGGPGAGAAAAAGARPLHRAVPRLLVLPDARGAARRRGLRPAVRAAGQRVRGSVLPAQHRECGHALPSLPRPRGCAPAPAGLRGGDDGAAGGHHGGGHRVLDAPAGLHHTDLAADTTCHEPLRAAVEGHGAAAAHLPACGHMEPDLGPLGLHPVSPVGAPTPAPTAQFPAPGSVLAPTPSPGLTQWALKDSVTQTLPLATAMGPCPIPGARALCGLEEGRHRHRVDSSAAQDTSLMLGMSP